MITLKPVADPVKLRRARRAADLTQEEIGNLLGVHKGQVCHYEKGRRKLSADEVKTWADACSIDVNDLYSMKPQRELISK